MTNPALQALETVLRDELEDANRSQQAGNDGRARVCARRAAGWAVGWYLEEHALEGGPGTALEHLKWLAAYPSAAEETRAAAARLTTKIELDGTLPFSSDPIEDARLIIHAMLGSQFDTG